MSVAEKIAAEARKLPEELAREVLDFILFIEDRHLSDIRTPAQLLRCIDAGGSGPPRM
jgi:hypothetical protein